METTVIVQLRFPQSQDRDQVVQAFRASIPEYENVPGLIRKYYLLSDDSGTVGGVYLFKSREAADKLFDEAWRATVKENYGVVPDVQVFATPVVMDGKGA